MKMLIFISCRLTTGQGRSRDGDRWICFPMLTLVCSLSLLPLNAWKCKKAFFLRLLDKNIIIFAIFFSTTLNGPPFLTVSNEDSHVNPPFCKFLKGRELISANQKKAEVTNAVKNYHTPLRSIFDHFFQYFYLISLMARLILTSDASRVVGLST